jgi:hypothetical protein
MTVEQETSGKQTPWEMSSLVGDFYFAGRERVLGKDVLAYKLVFVRLNRSV